MAVESLTLARLHRVWLPLGWFWVATVFYLSLMPHPPEPVSFQGADKFEHALTYVFLMLWFCQIYGARKQRVVVGMLFVAMGIGIEFLQGMTAYRMFEYADMMANTTGVAIGWVLAQTRMGCVLTMLEKNGKH